MAGKNRFNLLKTMLLPYEGAEIHINQLRSLILQNLASRPQGITEYLKLMSDSGIVREIKPWIYKVSLTGKYDES